MLEGFVEDVEREGGGADVDAEEEGDEEGEKEVLD